MTHQTTFRRVPALTTLLVLFSGDASAQNAGETIPLAEHPRPDLERSEWANLNGSWSFRFDAENVGKSEGWQNGNVAFPRRITVPFPWGSNLSGVPNEADIGWYARSITIPASWQGKRIFLVVGASDWLTEAWLDGNPVGSYRGGYTPFELELTAHARPGARHALVLRVDDTPHRFKLEGKQGYGPAKGIWQTPYLEARGTIHFRSIHFTPDIAGRKALVHAELSDPAPAGTTVSLWVEPGSADPVVAAVPEGLREARFSVPVPAPRLWSLDDPFLYSVAAEVSANGDTADRLSTYFGMREIGVVKLPGSGYPYIALNGKPIYLQMALDQAYHPDGFYTFPSDAFVRDEILRSRRVGLNGIRVHVKIDPPRKLYWADRLGLLVMADVPNSWGEPDEEMRRETEVALRGMIQRDYNHPSIFSWVLFNETWGLKTRGKGYTPATQDWVASMYELTKQLDPTRLVEDNSPCNLDHVVTDINSWHAYLPGYGWKERLDQICRDTKPGSGWNYIGDYKQDGDPLFNSECGNVWGYEGSTGDVDWSWDYHIMMNEFRRHPEVCGWLYTEHHDVVNEWNGYYRFDRSGKITGLAQIVPGMTLRDLHSPLYVAPTGELCRNVKAGERVSVSLRASFLTDHTPTSLVLHYELRGWDTLGREEVYARGERAVASQPWSTPDLDPLEVRMPDHAGLTILSLRLEDGSGGVHHRNFTTFLVGQLPTPRDETRRIDGHLTRFIRFAPSSVHASQWSLKQWNVLDGLKVNGAGSGFFEYRVPWPKDLTAASLHSGVFRVEVSAKQLFGKDQKGAAKVQGDFMRGRGTHDPSLNPNSYPMTDTIRFRSSVTVRAGGGDQLTAVGRMDLEDDPADHRGILSWHSQKRDRRLREAGSYGYLLSVPLTPDVLSAAEKAGALTLRLEVSEALPGGLAIYGERFGRYPVDPTVLLFEE